MKTVAMLPFPFLAIAHAYYLINGYQNIAVILIALIFLNGILVGELK